MRYEPSCPVIPVMSARFMVRPYRIPSIRASRTGWKSRRSQTDPAALRCGRRPTFTRSFIPTGAYSTCIAALSAASSPREVGEWISSLCPFACCYLCGASWPAGCATLSEERAKVTAMATARLDCPADWIRPHVEESGRLPGSPLVRELQPPRRSHHLHPSRLQRGSSASPAALRPTL